MNTFNITVPFEHNSHHYAGISAHNGVTFDLINAPCGEARQLISFGNCDNPPEGIFWDGVTATNDKGEACPQYLQLFPSE